MSPTPLGATRADVQAHLSKALSCKAHVRRQLSSQAWLVTTERKPDNLLLHCASCFVLLEEWRPANKAPALQPVVAGKPGLPLKQLPLPALTAQPRPSPEGPTKVLVNSSVSALEHKVDGRIDQLEARLEARLKTVEGQAQSQTQRLDEIDSRLFCSSRDIQGLSSQLQEGLEKVMGMIGRLQPSKHEPPGLRPKVS